MEDTIRLATQMQWPFMFAVAAVFGSVMVCAIVAMMTRSSERLAETQHRRDVELRKVDISVKNALVAQRDRDE